MAAEKKTTENDTKKDAIKAKITVKDSGPCKKELSVEVPEEMIKEKLDEQFSELSKDVVIPGFRRGRAPMRLVVKRFGEDVREQVKLRLLAETSDDAVRDNELDPLRDPDIDYKNVELPETGPMKYTFEVEVRPEFELPELTKIPVNKPKIEFDDKQLDQQIQAMRERAGMWVPSEEKVDEGDQIIADVVSKVEGEEQQNKEDNTEIFVREQGFVAGVPVEGLAKLLKGAKAGDTKETTVDVPETFFKEELRGKKVDLKIEVKDVKRLEPAEMNDEFFARFGVEDEDELRDNLREMRESQAEQDARSQMGDQVYQYLLEKTEFDLPANIVAEQSTRILQRQYTQLLMRGQNRDEINERMEELRAASDQQAVEQLKLFFIMDKIAGKFEIEVSEEEINGHIAQAAAQRGRRPEKMREELLRDGSLDQFRMQVREQKCIEKLLEDAEVTEGEAKTAKKKTAKKAEKAEKADDDEKTAKKKATKKKAAKPKEDDKKDKEEPKAASRKETEKKRTKKKTTKKED